MSRNAVIAALNPSQLQAQALAAHDGKIQALGSDVAIVHYIGKETKVLDLHSTS